jgi:hypothetical protein
MVKLEILIAILGGALTIFAFIECAMRDEAFIRRFPKWAWLLIIFFFGTLGSIFYLVAGREGGNSSIKRPTKKTKPRIIPPDDNPDFLRGL